MSPFEYVLVVTFSTGMCMNFDPTPLKIVNLSIFDKEKGPIITYQFPQSAKDEAIQSAPAFCFPEGNSILDKKETELETFSFTLTTGKGNKKFGYCRRFVSNTSEPECYCIISQRLYRNNNY